MSLSYSSLSLRKEEIELHRNISEMNPYLIFLVVVIWGAKPGSARGLLLSLCSGIIPDGLRGPIWDDGYGTWFSYMQHNCSTYCTLHGSHELLFKPFSVSVNI